jgi:heme exporter protein C
LTVRAWDRWLLALWALATAGMLAALYLVFVYAPDERVMGAVQRIFYFHVPAALVAFLSTYVMLAGCIGYLWRRQEAWDRLARAATELALLFCGLVLLSGPIWAKPAWGVWWTWEAKLTTTLLLALLLAASLLVRGYAESEEQGARFAAVLGIVAALDVPIIHKAVDWWRGQPTRACARPSPCAASCSWSCTASCWS